MMKKLLVLLLLFSSYSVVGQSLGYASNENTELKIEDFSIRPNPASQYLNITLKNFSSELKIEVFDVLGKRIYNGKINKLETSIGVSNWKSGVYLVRVSDDNSTHTKRFMKR